MEFPVSERTLLLWVVQLLVEIERGFTRRDWVSFISSSFICLPGSTCSQRTAGRSVPCGSSDHWCVVNKQESRVLGEHFINLAWKKGFPRVLLSFGGFLVMCGSSKTTLVLWRNPSCLIARNFGIFCCAGCLFLWVTCFSKVVVEGIQTDV